MIHVQACLVADKWPTAACRAPRRKVECLAQPVAPGRARLSEVSCFIRLWPLLFSCRQGSARPVAHPAPAKGPKADAAADKDKDAKDKDKKEVVEEKPVTTQHELRLAGARPQVQRDDRPHAAQERAGRDRGQHLLHGLRGRPPGWPREAAAHDLVQRRAGLVVGVAAPRRARAEAREDAGRRRDAGAALHARRQRAHLARPHRHGVHRPGGHGLQPRDQARARARSSGACRATSSRWASSSGCT